MFCQYGVIPVKSYTQHYGQSAKDFICYGCEGMSKKQIQPAASSSLMGCDGRVESSVVAVLAVLGYIQPPGKHTWLALHN